MNSACTTVNFAALLQILLLANQITIVFFWMILFQSIRFHKSYENVVIDLKLRNFLFPTAILIVM